MPGPPARRYSDVVVHATTYPTWQQRRLQARHAFLTAKVNSLLRPHQHKCHSVTFDNGKEFAGHEAIASELKADIYFAHPYHSGERRPNESSNGLLRQYFPKGMELIYVTEEQVQRAGDRINHPPRKVLGFRSPQEVFFGVKMRYTKSPPSVALQT